LDEIRRDPLLPVIDVAQFDHNRIPPPGQGDRSSTFL
jgi:hypothetical protein